MNVLVDRHHAGLLHSLQLLFEDRLGHTVYIPIGREWWEKDYWRFGAVFGDDRLARQYLDLNDTYVLHPDGYYLTWDVEFPERAIRCVTFDQFRELGDWKYTVATVQENQYGFWCLAGETGAKAVYQVGNRGQFVDWSLDPLALISAEAPILGRGIKYHQEYDKDGLFQQSLTAMNLAQDMRRVRSFVNCFPLMPEQWDYFTRARAVLEAEGWTFQVHGHDGPDGLVQPTEQVAHAMRNSGWGWQDKPQGDGFGHIIHYWASVGRPLIGHASYYEGLMPGPLWEEGVTSISLDGRSPEELAAVLRGIDGDRWITMCRKIRERLDELVNFDAEAEAIAAFLGE